jgi:hypothetical protein
LHGQFKMPPRSSLTSSFSITDSNNEVVCPLRNQDGSSCRKRCIGEKRYRSMQEHIRRAHPEHYISKLPATEESFLLMINSPPSDRPSSASQSMTSTSEPPATSQSDVCSPFVKDFQDRHPTYRESSSQPGTPKFNDHVNGGPMLGTASAAAVLAELHGVHEDREADLDGGYHSDLDGRFNPRASIELPPLHLSPHDITSDPFSAKPNRHILPSLLATTPPGRSSTLPPLQRPIGPGRQRKQSISKRGRESQHKKKNSRGSAADWLRRIQNEERVRPGGIDRKALSAEPSTDYGKRWEDLIDAADQAASAAGDFDDDRTPIPQSPVSIYRSSLPPSSHPPQYFHPTHNYQASPLQQALTPPSHTQDQVDPFPSVESIDNGQNIEIYCAACSCVSRLKDSYACTECISGLCHACVEVLMAEHGARRKCPRCATIGGRFKPFQLDIR